MEEIRRLLSTLDQHDPSVGEQLLPLVYEELRKLAAVRLALERPGQTLQATALVHEAYLRLIGGEGAVSWDSPGHFFSAAAEAMRRILVESARRKQRIKHGGDLQRVELDEAELAMPELLTAELHEDLLDLDEALEKLEREDPAAAKIVRLRYFAGLSIPDVARMMDISPRSADRLWAFARAWLHRELRRTGEK
jgi:RNA polymerase sigma factor (TIGR02999 family)